MLFPTPAAMGLLLAVTDLDSEEHTLTTVIGVDADRLKINRFREMTRMPCGSSTKKQISEFIGMHPFVCKKYPFICINTSVDVPIVGQKVPSVVNIKFYNGFNIIELMIVLVVVGVLAALAVPGMHRLIQNQRLSGQANDLVADLAYARSEAIRRQTPIVVCKTADPTAVGPTCLALTPNAWTTGRLIFADVDNDGVRDGTEEVLRARQALEGEGNRLNGDGNSAGTANNVTFLANGLTTLIPPAGSSENQLFLCDNRGPNQAYAIVIGVTGRVRIAPKGKDMSGSDLLANACL